MTTSSSRMRRAASADRLSKASYLDTGIAKCDLVGFPYCCTKHCNTYRRWPYYLDPADYPYPHRYHSRLRYWPDYWPYNSYYYDHYQRRPWYYYEDDYYGDYLRGYAEGMRKFDVQRKRSTSVADLTAAAAADPITAATYADRYWWYCKPYRYRRYL